MLAQVEGSRHVLVGQSPRIRHILRLIDKLGHCRWPVLLLGETGTGKEVVARSIHDVNAVGPFVTIDCSSLVGPLMESELFGHMKGSFTGAINSKIGLIELASGGTAFLDEIGELPLDLQAKLLRVLQEKEFRPVGSLQPRRSDFRVIAATNRDLAREVEKGTFRRDLYYRLNVVNLKLAPLYERKEDIPALIAHFLSRYGRNHSLTQETLEAMLSYEWPGNVRELENSIQHMVAINSGPLLHTTDLPSSVQNHLALKKSKYVAMAAAAQQSRQTVEPPVRSVESGSVEILPLTALERRAILEALEFTKGDRAVAAHLLGIGRTTLYRKLKEYQLDI
ncbi:MAG TPA: sigma-54 dependent transcriptional regulator [Bryobacteraceae bacterium]|nr:sigma-54 dependent transcriptional regulator [Bryobacteraceae bacterium]